MKKNISLLIACLAIVLVNAQTSKGNFLFGGDASLSFSSQKTKVKSDNSESDLFDSSTINFIPGAGYFVIDNLAAGLQVQFSSVKQTSQISQTGDLSVRTNSFLVNPFVRYYFTQGTAKPYVQGSVGVGSSKETVEGTLNDGETKNGLFAYGFDGGVAIFLNSNVAINVGVGYSSVQAKAKDDNPFDEKTITRGIAVGVGFNIFLK